MHHWFKKKKKETTFQGEQKACIKISDQFQDALLISETLEVSKSSSQVRSDCINFTLGYLLSVL